MEYRNENKYICTPAQLIEINNRLGTFMKIDSHIQSDEGYNIRSIYFDDYEDYFFNENDAGVDERFKVRIRIYDKDKKNINLEIKSKKNGLIKKESCTISQEICELMVQGKCPAFAECKHDVLRRVYVLMQTRYLQPKIIVEYERFAFVDPSGNVRITFDRYIRSSNKVELFFEDNIESTFILDYNHHVLEVKYDEFLPDHIASCLELKRLNRTSFSKYYLSRIKLGEM